MTKKPVKKTPKNKRLISRFDIFKIWVEIWWKIRSFIRYFRFFG